MSESPDEELTSDETPSGDPDRDSGDGANEAPDQGVEEHLDADEGDPDLDAYPGSTP
jgi:hypothetical protein